MDLVDAIEAAIHQDVGRNIAPMFAATSGGLRAGVMALALGGPMAWKDKLVTRLEQKNAA